MEQLKDCLIYYALANGYQLWFEKSDMKKLLVRCGLAKRYRRNNKLSIDPNVIICPFYMRAVKMKNERSVQIITLKEQYACSRKYYYGPLITSRWIAQLQEYVIKKYVMQLSYSQCARAKRIALYQLKQSATEQYGKF